MARPTLRIEVTTKDQKELRKLLRGGVQPVRVVLRALALLQLAKGVSAPRISMMVALTPQAIRKVGHRYQQGGPGTGALREGTAWRGCFAGGQPEAAYHRHGLQRSAGRACPLDGAAGGRGSHQKAACS